MPRNRTKQKLVHEDSKIKTAFSIPQEFLTIPKVIIFEKTDDFSFGDALIAYYTILEKIFTYLDRKDLEAARFVSSIWCNIAVKELERRMKPSWVEICIHPATMILSDGFINNHAAVGIVAYNSEFINLSDKICLHYPTGPVLLPFSQYIKEMLMCNDSNFITIDSVISCSLECPNPLKLTSNSFCRSNCQSIFFPKIPNIKIRIGSYLPNQKYGSFFHPNEIVLSALVFTQKFCVQTFNAFCIDLFDRRNPKEVALAGGILYNASTIFNGQTTTRKRNMKKELFSVVFSQEVGEPIEFNAYSRIFKGDKDEFESDLLKFIRSGLCLRKNGVVFRFCCNGKCGEYNETVILDKHFPTYEILGLQVGGEIGWNSKIPNSTTDFCDDPTEKMPKTRLPKHEVLHSFTTALFLVTWGSKIDIDIEK